MDATPTDVSRDVREIFLRADETGLKLAIIGRTVALVLLGIWLLASRADDPARLFNYSIALSVLAALGLFHYFLIAARFDRRWLYGADYRGESTLAQRPRRRHR